MAKTSTTFKEGQGGRKKGAKNKETIAKEALQSGLWEAIAEKMTTAGIEKYWNELMTLEGKDYLWGYNQLLEYFKPKLSRATLGGGDKAIEIKQVFKIGDKEFEL